jgi:hypothetical protein
MTGASDQRRALRILADAGQNGATEAIMMAYGFTRGVLAGLVLAELANGRDQDDASGRCYDDED